MFQKFVNGAPSGAVFDADQKPDAHMDGDDYVVYKWASPAAQALQEQAYEFADAVYKLQKQVDVVETLDYLEVTEADAADLARRLLAGEFKSKGDVLAALNSPFVEVKEVY